MGRTGGCRCGAVRYEAEGEPEHVSLCWCTECRRSAGAPVVGWALFAEKDVQVTGSATDYESSPGTVRAFCPTCGTGLFYRNPQIFPERVDIQLATLDDPGAVTPQAHIQVADAPGWMGDMAALPRFERYPGAP